MIKSIRFSDPAAIDFPQSHTATPEPTLSVSGKTMLPKWLLDRQGSHSFQSGENKLAIPLDPIKTIDLSYIVHTLYV